MIDVNKLRSHYADAEVASALFNGLPHYSERTKSREQLQKARDAIAMLVSFISLTLDADDYEDCGEDASKHRQVAKEAAENALHYGEELLKMIGEAK